MNLKRIVCINSIIIFMITVFVSLLSINLYAGNDTIKFGLQAYRKANKEGNQFSYQVNGQMIWKPVKYENDGSTYTYNDTIYCLKAETGFYRNKPGNYTQDYDRSYDFKESKDLLNTSIHFDQYVSILWILNHAYIPNTETSEEEKESLLAKVGLYPEEITEDEIDIIQQLAIWYFTNQKEEENSNTYHVEENGIPSLQEISRSLKNEVITTLYEKTEENKKENLEKLFTYFIDNARQAKQGNEQEKVDIDNSEVEAINQENQYIVGPYRITKEEELKAELELKIFDQDNQELGGVYSILDERKNKVENLNNIEELVGKKFYITIPSTEKEITSISVNLLGKYKENKITYWTKNGDTTVQPLVNIERVDHNVNICKTIELPKIESNYNIELISTDYDNEELKLAGSKYEITNPDGTVNIVVTDENGRVDVGNFPISQEGIQTYNIQQLEASNGYLKEEQSIKLTVETKAKNGKYIVESHQIEGNAQSELKNNQLYIITKSKQFDLGLRLFVSEVGKTKINREPQIDMTNLNQVEKNKKITTATYEHSKAPVTVGANDVITYTVRVYNEGNVDGYADEITFYLPPELEMINDLANYPEETNFNAGYRWRIVPGDIRKIKSNYLSYSSSDLDKEKNEKNKILAGDKEKLKYQEIQIKCKVKAGVASKSKMTAFMQITKASNEQGKTVLDRDSNPDGNFTLPVDEELAGYKENDIIQNARQVKGQEDDDDFEQIVMQDFDFSMRQWISKINNKKITGREPNIDFSSLTTRTETTAQYHQTKQILDVKRGDTITYTIRVYNEGDVNGYASIVTSYLPSNLTLIVEDEINQKYKWKISEDGRIVTTDYLAEHKIHYFEGNALSSEEIQIVCKVKDEAKFESYLTVLTEITECKDEEGNIIVDRDSTTHNLSVPEDKNLEFYQKDEIERNTSYIPGEEDDTDFDKIRVVYFKLAIKQFPAKINDVDMLDRIPSVKVEGNQVAYEKMLAPLEVENGNNIIYNIRVYNEGLMDGYASKIVYQLGEEVTFNPEDRINQEHGWKMYQEARIDQIMSEKEENFFTYQNKKYVETKDSEKAKILVSEYLAKENGEIVNKIKARNMLELECIDYKEIPISLTIKQQEDKEESKIANIVELVEVRDENNEIPENKNTKLDMSEMLEEKMQDIEYIKVKTFDLSIANQIQNISIVTDGVSREVSSEKQQKALNEIPLKMTDNDSTIVKLKCSLCVTNRGEIPGYVSEIEEILSESYQVKEEENSDWKIVQEEGKKILKTQALSNRIIQPGESIEIPLILEWKYDFWNMGENIIITKITKTDNDSKTIDKKVENNEIKQSIFFTINQTRIWEKN